MRGLVGLWMVGLCVLAMSSPARAEQVAARGVNPAENDTRFDVIFKYNWLNGGSSIFTSTLKFDYRISREFGLNFELPVLGHFRSPAPVPGVPGMEDTGIGDVFARLRYIVPVATTAFGSTSAGGAVEAVFPTATRATLGSGTYQLNATALLVQAWSPTVFTAFVAKSSQSVHALDGRSRVQENAVRVVQAFVLPQGMFVTLDARYNWETINRRDVWYDAAIEFGRMLDAQTAVSVNVGRRWGDRQDRGAVAVTFKRFF